MIRYGVTTVVSFEFSIITEVRSYFTNMCIHHEQCFWLWITFITCNVIRRSIILSPAIISYPLIWSHEDIIFHLFFICFLCSFCYRWQFDCFRLLSKIHVIWNHCFHWLKLYLQIGCPCLWCLFDLSYFPDVFSLSWI